MQALKGYQIPFTKRFFFSVFLLSIAGLLIIPLASSSCFAAQLTIAHGGNGSGSVSSTPPGIDCGATCSHTFLDTESVVLDAVADGSSLFMGWDGCDQVTGSQCTVDMATAHTVTVLFDAVTTADYYVSSTGDDSNSGLGWSRPFQTITQALSIAQNGEEIWVKAGVYVPPVVSESFQSSYFTISNKVNLYGGFAGGETERDSRDPQNSRTIIDARSSGYFGQGFHVNTQNDTGPGRARIDGFVIRGGWALGRQYPFDTGGGIIVYRGAPLIANCDIKFNYAISGGGIAAGYNTTIVNCRIYSNNAQNYGGGIVGNSGVQVINSSVFNNYSTYSGGGIAFWGGGEIHSTTVAGNTCSSSSGTAGVHGYSQGTNTITNSIIWGNTQGGNPSEIEIATNASANITYSNIRGGYIGIGNIDADPLFADPSPSVGDLRLQPASQCINTGNNADVYTDVADLDEDGNTAEQLPVDFAGNPRIETTVDMGAYEYISGLYPEYTLNVTVDPAHGAIVSGLGGICDSSCSILYYEGFQLTATATPNSPNRFAYWDGCDSTDWDQCTVTMDSAKSITAHVVDELADADSDTMLDWWEWFYFHSLARNGNGDADGDGLPDKDEFSNDLDPTNYDSDDDSMPDGWELANNLDPAVDDADLDADSDTLTNLEEYELGTNPQSDDSDADGMLDAWEVSVGLNPTVNDAAGDNDGDGVSNLQEFNNGTDPTTNYDLTYTSGANGTIDGDLSQTVNEGEGGASVEAVADNHYHFVDWSDGSTNNPRTDSNVMADITVTANFVIDTVSLMYTSNGNGSISGDDAQTVDYGSAGTAVTAVPDSTYHFVEWSDGSTDNPRTDTNITDDIAVTAIFSNILTLEYSAGANGTLSGETSQEVSYASNGTTVTAVPDNNYHFVNWSDGSTINPRTDSNVTADISVTASYALDTFTLTYGADPNGTIAGDTLQTVDYGTSGTAVTAVAAGSYHFVDWSDGSTTNPRTDSNVTSDASVSANFSIDIMTLIYDAGEGGTLSGDNSQTVDYGENGTAITVVPDSEHYFLNWSDGLTDNPRIDTNVIADIAVTANLPSISAGSCALQISGGSEYSLTVKTDGTLWTWGDNSYGKLGDGTGETRPAPIQVGSDTDWQKGSTGHSHTVAIKTDGTLWAWGKNGNGQLGIGSNSTEYNPVQVGTEMNWLIVAAGNSYTAAVTSDGTLWTWGGNSYGQLGDGTTVDKNIPTQVGFSTDWKTVVTAYGHTVAIKNDGSLWAWGYNNQGQLGDGTTVNKNIPTQIGIDSDWQACAVGSDHSMALKSDGTLWAWGRNAYGVFGNGTLTSSTTPIQVGSDTDWQAVATSIHALALKIDGTLWAWGRNYEGQLGDGTTLNKNIPVQIGSGLWREIAAGSYHTMAVSADGVLSVWGFNSKGAIGDGLGGSRNTPVPIATGTSWQTASVGQSHSLAVAVDGSLWAWGDTGSGKLGDGDFSYSVGKNVPVRIGEAVNWQSVFAGYDHSLALTTSGELWAWGGNSYGQLGDGTNSSRYTPVQIGSATNWQTISSGPYNTLALKTDHTLWSWGRNQYAELGDGTTVNSNTPNQVGTDTDWQMISAGNTYAHALKTNGTLWAWGSNNYGQLGDGTATTRTVPTQIGTDTDWSTVSDGGYHTLALKANGTLWAWGGYWDGVLGNGGSSHQYTPTQIGSDADWQSVYAGGAFSLAIKSDGTLWAWGDNASGQLADGTFTDRWTPVQVSNDTNWQMISAGAYHVASVKADNTLFTWGKNYSGQLGDGTSFRTTPVVVMDNRTFVVSSLAPVNGQIYPLFPKAVCCTGVAQFTLSPDINARVAEITGTCPAGSLVDNGDGTWDYTTGIIAENCTVAAFFDDSYVLTYSAGSNGSLTGEVSQRVYHGDDGSVVTAAGETGYHFVSWSDGLMTAARTDLNITAYFSVTASFELNIPHTLTYTAGPNGTVNGDTVQNVEYGEDGTIVTAVGDSNYHFVSWSDGVTSASRTENSVTEHISVTANFAYNAPLTLSYAAGSNGGITGDLFQTIPFGTDGVAVTAVAATGYYFVSWSDGLLNAVRTDSIVAGNISVSAEFSINSYTVNYTAGVNGRVSGDSSQSVVHGSSATAVMAIGDTGYHFVSWSDGSTSAVRTDINVTGNIAVTAAFAADTSHTLTYTAGANGSLSGTLSQTVNYGADGSTVTATADSGYYFVDWSDGIIEAVRKDLNVTGNISVTANFTEDVPTVASQIAAGAEFSMVIKSDGTLWGWGKNSNGQLGDGSSADQIIPVQIGTARNWKSVSTGNQHTLAIRDDGSLWAWGYNGYGQLGFGNNNSTSVPVQVGTSIDWESVSTLAMHTLAIKTDGTLWAWGYNSQGQLGIGNNDNSLIPVQVGIATYWQSVAVGGNHTLAIRTDGSLWAWGYNGSGQLGTGDTVSSNIPVQVGAGLDWTAVAASSYHSLAVKSEGSLWAWGYASQGQLGTGSSSSNTPVQVGVATDWQSVTAGSYHTLAIKTNGHLWAWGRNSQGQLGDGTTVSQTVPVQVGSGAGWQTTATGNNYTLAMQTDGSLWVWGSNEGGLFGNGLVAEKNNPVQISAATDWQAVSANGFSMFALKNSGDLWAWGANASGQLGDGSLNNRQEPVSVASLSSVTAVAAGGSHSLGVKTDATLWAWGTNTYAQLGNGTNSTAIPLQVGTDTNWQLMVGRDGSTLALKTDGSLWAWGTNNVGQLGDGTSTSRDNPVPIEAGTTWQSVEAGSRFTVAIKSDGSMWAWGYNGWGQLGIGSTTTTNIPLQVGSDTDWQSVAACTYHVLAIKNDGSLWAWGYNSYAVFGNNTTTSSTVPVHIGTDTDWQAVGAGHEFSMAIKTDGSLWAWGKNSWGELGGATASWSSKVPVQIEPGTSWTSFAAANQSAVALRTDNTLWTWGRNVYGELGDGTSFSTSPLQLSAGQIKVVTPSVVGNGSIDPVLAQDVVLGGRGQFTLNPDPSNFIVDITGTCSAGELIDNGDGSWLYTTGSVMADCTVIANFADTVGLTYTSGVNGAITGNTSQMVAYGADGTTVSAVPDAGYVFVNWSDGVTTPDRTDTIVQSTISVTASFSNTVVLEYSAGTNGTLLGEISQLVSYDGTGTSVAAIADEGYSFVDWSDGGTSQIRTDTNVTASIGVMANFASDIFTLTYTAEANGTIAGDTPQGVTPGGAGTAVTAQALAGYSFITWDDGISTAERTETSVNSDLSFTAQFTPNPYTLTSSVSGGHGNIDPLGTQTVSHGETAQFALVPEAGYNSGPVISTCGGVLLGNTFTTDTIADDCTVEAMFTLPGDINGDDVVDVKDIIIGLQLLTGDSDSVFSSAADSNGDGRIGLAEVLFILEEISQ